MRSYSIVKCSAICTLVRTPCGEQSSPHQREGKEACIRVLPMMQHTHLELQWKEHGLSCLQTAVR